jgi:hypothetical protein
MNLMNSAGSTVQDFEDNLTWRDVDHDIAGRLIFFQRKCPECWLRDKESLLLLTQYNNGKKVIATYTCVNCRFDTNDI